MPEINKEPKEVSDGATTQNRKPQEKQLSEAGEALGEIRRMFNTQRYAVSDDDDDDSDIEANFDEIMNEEKTSARLASKEDEEQFRLIEEEQRREGLGKLANNTKLSDDNEALIKIRRMFNTQRYAVHDDDDDDDSNMEANFGEIAKEERKCKTIVRKEDD